MATQSDSFNDRQKVWELIKDIKIALMVTSDDTGHMRGRPMAAMNMDLDGDLWFASRDGASKLGEIADHDQVLLAYSEPTSQNYVSVAGTAMIVRDREKIHALWSEGARVWFPQGPDDPNLVLIRVVVDSAEYWDAPSSAWLYAYGYVKARLTGQPPRHVGENKLVNF